MAVSRRNYGEPELTDTSLGGGIGVPVDAPSTLGDGLRITGAGQCGFSAGDLLVILVATSHGLTSPVTLTVGPTGGVGANWTRLFQVVNTTGGTQAPSQIEAWYAFATADDVAHVNAGNAGLSSTTVDTTFETPAVFTQAFAFSGHDNSVPLFATVSETDSNDSVSLPAVTASRAGSMVLRQFATIDPIDNPPGAVSGLTVTGYYTAAAFRPIRGVNAVQNSTVISAAAVAVPWSNDATAQVVGATIVVRAPNNPPGQPGAFTSPTSGQVVDASVTPAWGAATDPDGTGVVYDLYFSRDNWATSSLLANDIAGTSYVHNTSAVASSTACSYRVYAFDPSGASSVVRQSPTFTIQHNVAPNTAVLGAPTGGQVIDRTVTQRLHHTFSDPNPGDTQSKFDWRYKLVGAGSWTTATVLGSQTYVDVASGFFAEGNYERQVLVYDAIGTQAAAWSSSSCFTAETPPPGPTITQPVNNGTIPTSSGTVDWSTATQDAFEVQILGDLAGSPDPSDVRYTSGTVESPTARNHPLDFPDNGDYIHIQVRTRDDGLWSSWSSVRDLVDFTPPAEPTVAVAVVETTDVVGVATQVLGVTIGHPTPTGTQPAVTGADLWRRELDRAGQPIAGTEIPVARGLPTGQWLDHTVASSQPYQYQAVALGNNDTTSTSAWTG